MEEYISHEEYKKMLKGFGKQTPKSTLNEMHTMDKQDGPREFHKLPADIEEDLENEGNAFTAGLAKTKHGGKFKVGDKVVKDTSDYDASVNEYQFDQMYPDDPGPFEGDDMGEGINSAPMQATGPTIQTVEEKSSRFSHLTSEEMDQLKQYAESIKTIKEQIMKMVNKKPEMEEGGDMTGLVMRPTTTSEGEDDENY